MQRSRTTLFALVVAFVLLTSAGQLAGQTLTQPLSNLPPPPGTYISPSLFHQLYAMGIVIKNVSHSKFTASQPPPPPAGTQTHTFNSEVTMMVSTNGGTTFNPVTVPNANVSVQVTSTPAQDIGNTRTFNTEMLSLNLSGGTLPAGVMVRESPTLASTGTTHVTPISGGQFHIDSFFDIFTELTLDGGATWMPATNGPAHMTLQGDPKPPIVTPSPNLPAIPSHYVSPADYHAAYANGIVIKDVSHERFLHNDPPPDTGAVGSTHGFGSTVRMQVSTNGGQTFNPMSAPATVSVHVHKMSGPGGSPTGTFDTEMLSLSIQGGTLPAGVMIRESPSKASPGQTKITQDPGGQYLIDSFFDIFTEVSVDGGLTWSPSQGGPAHMELEPDPPPIVTTNPNLPPIPSHYVSPATWRQAYANGIVIKDVSHESFTHNDPPPAPDSTRNHTFGSTVRMQVSTNGGQTFQPATGSGNVMVRVKHKSDNGGTQYFETEMLQLDLTGSGFMVRESPTKPSLGKTSITPLPGGSFGVSSFFDIFTDLSVDGGQTWSPATNGPEQMELQPTPDSICGMKWEDKNGNGVKDPGEPGLAGWKIRAVDTVGTVFSAVTDAGGNYCFAGLNPGKYRIEEVLQAGWMQTGGQPYYTINIAAGQVVKGVDFGNFRNGSIYGMKFNDLNGNGVKDPGEPGLPGWTICVQRNQPPPSTTFPTTGGTDFLGGTLAIVNINLRPTYGGVNITLCASGNAAVQRANPSGPMTNDSMKTEITVLELVGTLPPPFPNDTFHIRHVANRRSYGVIRGNSFPAISFFDVFYEVDMPASLGGGTYVNYTATRMDANGGGGITTIPPGGQNYLGYNTYLVNKNVPSDTLGLIKLVNHCVIGGAQAGTRCDPPCTKAPPNPVPPGAPLGTACIVTDSSGNYCFMNLPPGSYTLTEMPQAGWTQTTLDPPKIIIGSGSNSTGNDFGNHRDSCPLCIFAWYDQNHNQQPRDNDDTPMGAGIKFVLTLPDLSKDTLITDATGQVCTLVPIGKILIQEIVPDSFTVSFPKGNILSVMCDGASINVDWLNSAAVTDTLFRTATMVDWAYAQSVNLKAKLKPEKCKPDKVRFKFNLRVPIIPGTSVPASVLNLKFNMPVDTLRIWFGKSKQIQLVCPPPTIDPKRQVWQYDFNNCVPQPQAGDTIQFDGRGLKGKPIAVAYKWLMKGAALTVVAKGTLPGPNTAMPGDTLKVNVLLLPMPDLTNVLQDLLDQQGAFPVVIGDPASPNSVTHLKVSDIEKSLVKVVRGQFLVHTGPGRCLDSLANGKLVTKQQKSLPPAKQNNVLFAEALALKLNILASQHFKFPAGLCELIYDNHKDQQAPTNPIFDGKTVCEIMAQVDSFLGCKHPKLGTSAADFLAVVRNINKAFAGPIDTIRWGCNKLFLKGVRRLKDVTYLRGNPGIIPPYAPPDGPMVVRTQPTDYSLRQNYPNPFNPTTTIEFVLPNPAIVTLKVYDMLGREVATLLNREAMEDGNQEIEFDAGGLPSGVYFYRIVAQTIIDEEEGTLGQTFMSVKKMILIK